MRTTIPTQALSPAQAARMCRCGYCWAEPGQPCRPEGDHIARYARAWRRGLLALADVPWHRRRRHLRVDGGHFMSHFPCCICGPDPAGENPDCRDDCPVHGSGAVYDPAASDIGEDPFAEPITAPDCCPETSDGYHCGHWQDGADNCCACGADGTTCPDCGRLDCEGDGEDPPRRQP